MLTPFTIRLVKRQLLPVEDLVRNANREKCKELLKIVLNIITEG